MKKQAFNPFLPLNEYIPDGEPHVFGDRVYLFGSHDREGGNEYCELGNYIGWSAPLNDLSDWRNEGVIYSIEQHPTRTEENKFLYAPDVVQGNDGKFYLYYCMNGFAQPISVAVADEPCGKYKYLGFVRNADGTPLMRFIPGDPAVINDGGTIRLYYGWSLSMTAAKAHGAQTDESAMKMPEAKKFIQQGEAMMFHRSVAEIENEEGGSVMGAVVCTLEDDMLTVKVAPKRIVPGEFMAQGTSFEGHAFYEASSIRKINGKYYFIYSSQESNELCYATSDSPDKDFVYGGTIISNGDVGYNGRKADDRLNLTANNHGSVECINGKWYIFYHRQTHSSAFSRQACAEEIEILSDGSIPQVEMTSCGLNGKPLEAEGEYPVAICCNLTNGRMPHITNRKIEADIPYVTHSQNARFITNIKSGVRIGYKYFSFNGKYELSLKCRGDGDGVFLVYCGNEKAGEIPVKKSRDWQTFSGAISANGTKSLEFVYNGDGVWQVLSFGLQSKSNQ